MAIYSEEELHRIMVEYEKAQIRRLEEIEQLSSCFTHDDIKAFHTRHLGNRNRRNYGPSGFIPTENFYRDEYAAIYGVLSFLDRHGDVLISSTTGTTLREHNLCLAEVAIRSLRNKSLSLSSFYVFPVGFAALANNIGLGLGAEYCEPFKGKSSIGVGQASLALLEQMPEFCCLQKMEEIQEIIKFYHICVEASINAPKIHVERENEAWKLAKLLANAEHQVRRQETFHTTAKPTEGFWSAADEQTKARKYEEAVEIAQQAAQERQQLAIKDNREAYLTEISGLRNKARQLVRVMQELKLKNKYIAALQKLVAELESGKEKAIIAARIKLEVLETKLRDFMDSTPPHESEVISTEKGL